MPLLVLIFSAIVLFRRWRAGATRLVPTVMLAMSTASIVHSMLALAATYRAVAHASPQERPTILSAGIGEMLHHAMQSLPFEALLLLGFYVVDRLIRSKSGQETDISKCF